MIGTFPYSMLPGSPVTYGLGEGSVPSRIQFEAIVGKKTPLVYVVDDDDAVRNSLRALLESYQLEVEDYTSGASFFRHYTIGMPGCLLLDMNMPEMDGLEVLGHLRNDMHSDIPVVMITGQKDEPTKARLLAAGATSYFEKPMNVDELIETVLALTGQQDAGASTMKSNCCG